jgi:hypothetical protein
MQSVTQYWCSVAGVAAVLLLTSGCNAATSTEAQEAVEEGNTSYQAQLRAAKTAREKNPDWKPAQEEVGMIRVGTGKRGSGVSLTSFCVGRDGNLLACTAGTDEKSKEHGIRVYSPEGKLLKTIGLPVAPGAICVDAEGAIYVGGGGRILKLDQEGKVLASADSPVAKAAVSISKEVEDMLKESKRDNQAERAKYLKYLEQRRGEVTGMGVTKEDVFMACASPDDFTYRVYRMDRQLGNPKLVVESLRGCCGQMDIQAANGQLWIPHNARHRVECRDREGKEVAQFGKAGRVKPEQFGGCCEPKNLRIMPSGEILAAESGPPTCIKKFSREGKFLGVVAVVESDGSCVRVTVDMSPDGKRFYLLDTDKNAIRVFGTRT